MGLGARAGAGFHARLASRRNDQAWLVLAGCLMLTPMPTPPPPIVCEQSRSHASDSWAPLGFSISGERKWLMIRHGEQC
jgi:hypothetical protein